MLLNFLLISEVILILIYVGTYTQCAVLILMNDWKTFFTHTINDTILLCKYSNVYDCVCFTIKSKTEI